MLFIQLKHLKIVGRLHFTFQVDFGISFKALEEDSLIRWQEGVITYNHSSHPSNIIKREKKLNSIQVCG